MSEKYWAVIHPADVKVGDEVTIVECGEPVPAAASPLGVAL